MAPIARIAVIYSMIAIQKTSTATRPVQAAQRFTQIHWMMTIVGIVTAIACSIIMLNESQPGANLQKEIRFLNTPKLTVAYQLSE